VEDITALQKGKLGKGLKDFLTEEVVDKGKSKESLLVIDPHLCMHFLFLLFFPTFTQCVSYPSTFHCQKTEYQRERSGGEK
jgi:hypothetical protein